MKTLQLEQLAVVGFAEEPSVVASRMRLVFSTLEVSFYFLDWFVWFPESVFGMENTIGLNTRHYDSQDFRYFAVAIVQSILQNMQATYLAVSRLLQALCECNQHQYLDKIKLLKLMW